MNGQRESKPRPGGAATLPLMAGAVLVVAAWALVVVRYADDLGVAVFRHPHGPVAAGQISVLGVQQFGQPGRDRRSDAVGRVVTEPVMRRLSLDALRPR